MKEYFAHTVILNQECHQLLLGVAENWDTNTDDALRIIMNCASDIGHKYLMEPFTEEEKQAVKLAHKQHRLELQEIRQRHKQNTTPQSPEGG